MKPHLLKIALSPSNSFSIRHDVVPYFFDRWHYHPEIEFIYIKEGNGTEFMGDHIRPFREGDLLLVGSGLPHYWHCSEEYFKEDSGMNCEAVVAHFHPDFLGEKFLGLPENKVIRELLKNAKRGILVNESVRDAVVDLLFQMLQATECRKLLLLLSALEIIASSRQEFLCSEGFVPNHDAAQTETINQIYAYSLANFHRRITLEEIAAVAHLSPNSFCRHFKSHTRKTYSEFLQEIRVGHACKLLIEGRLTIGHICEASGFNTFANFYRYFKLITGKTPQQYQQMYNRKQAA
jgi:AraC-like DNA-binding protein